MISYEIFRECPVTAEGRIISKGSLVGALLRNPMPQLLAEPRPGRILARRLDQLAEELGFDRARLLGWGVAQAVLSAWWSLEGHGHGWEPGIACAEILATFK